MECQDVQAPGVGAMCGPCPDGFDGNGMKCTGIVIVIIYCISSCCNNYERDYFPLDIDECANATLNNCQQVCVNSEGAYTCDCSVGYSLTNSTHCEGILYWPGANYSRVLDILYY